MWMVDHLATNVLGTLVLLVTALGAYYSYGLKSNLAGSELANVWKFIGMGVILLFLGALAGGGSSLIGLDSLTAILVFMLLGSIFLAYGLKLQLDKVK
jgi:hypothetical protein